MSDEREMAVDPNVGGGVDRSKIPDQDFAGPDRSFPIVTPGDVSDAASSLGRAKGDRNAIKRRIISIARRKGASFVKQLPAAWGVEATESDHNILLGGYRLAVGKPIQLVREGEWDHPEYGKFAISEADIDRMVANFDAKVTKQDAPIDIDHDHSRGAVGWLQRVFKSFDDSGRAILRGIVDWTDEGISQVGTAFKHTSIHYDPNYTDAETSTEYGPTLRSASITNFPFVKDMEPISLSEFKSYKEAHMTEEKKDDAVALSEEETKQVKGILPRLLSILNKDPEPKPEPEPEPARPEAAKLSEVKLAEAQAETKKLAEVVEAQSKELAEIKLARRQDRFNELMERGKWVGDRAVSLSLMNALADTKGEDSDEFKAYVAQQDASAKQIWESKLFEERGTSLSTLSGDEKRDAELTEIREAQGLKNDAAGNSVALVEYYRRHPDQYAAAQRENDSRKREA